MKFIVNSIKQLDTDAIIMRGEVQGCSLPVSCIVNLDPAVVMRVVESWQAKERGLAVIHSLHDGTELDLGPDNEGYEGRDGSIWARLSAKALLEVIPFKEATPSEIVRIGHYEVSVRGM
jgi:hypothetical protein